VFENVTRRARRMAAVVATGALAVTGLALPVVVNASPAAADNLTVATVTATVSTPNFSGQATDGLVDGQTIHVVADATGSERITSIQARICTQNANVQFDADFNPTQGGKCASAPLSANSDATVSANGTPGAAPIHAALDIRAGVGSNSYTTQSAQAVTITCNAANPCDLYVKVNNQSTTAQYKHFVMTFAGNPSAPANLGATPSPSQVALAWDVPTDLGNVPSSAISYTINYTDGVTPGSTTSSTNSKTLTLSNFSTYTFTVTANSIGSFASSPSGSAQATPQPAGPTALGGAAAGGGASLAWTAPGTAGVTDYRVTFTPSGGLASTLLTGSTGVTYNLTGLTNGTQYSITVAAKYAGGFTSESNTFTVTPTAAVQGESFTVVVPTGSLTLTSAAGGAVNLGTATLDTTARFWESTGTLSALTVQDTRASATTWSLSIVSSSFVSGANTFPGSNVGITPTSTSHTTDTAPVLGSVVAPRGGSGNNGIGVSRTFATSASSANLGQAVLSGNLKISVPTSQTPGTYTGTLTITAL
jgi:hypothetical protein